MPLFFMQVRFTWRKDELRKDVFSTVFGPFDTQDALQAYIDKNWAGSKESTFVVFDGDMAFVRPSPKEKPENEKRVAGDMKNYAGNPEDGYVCRECDGPVLGAQVAHPIHSRMMPGAGSGECQYEMVPYCPNCDKKPNYHGAPVLEDP